MAKKPFDVMTYVVERDRERCRIFGIIAKAISNINGLSIEDKGVVLDRVMYALTRDRKHTVLTKEHREAERALAEEPSELNFAWLQDVRKQLGDMNAD